MPERDYFWLAMHYFKSFFLSVTTGLLVTPSLAQTSTDNYHPVLWEFFLSGHQETIRGQGSSTEASVSKSHIGASLGVSYNLLSAMKENSFSPFEIDLGARISSFDTGNGVRLSSSFYDKEVSFKRNGWYGMAGVGYMPFDFLRLRVDGEIGMAKGTFYLKSKSGFATPKSIDISKMDWGISAGPDWTFSGLGSRWFLGFRVRYQPLNFQQVNLGEATPFERVDAPTVQFELKLGFSGLDSSRMKSRKLAGAEQACYEEAGKDNPEKLMSCLTQFPKGKLEPQGTSTLAVILDNSTSQKDLEWFVAQYPESPNSSRFRTRLEEIKIQNEEQEYRRASQANTIELYEAFLTAWPNGKHTEQAAAKLAEVRQENEKKNSGRAYDLFRDYAKKFLDTKRKSFFDSAQIFVADARKYFPEVDSQNEALEKKAQAVWREDSLATVTAQEKSEREEAIQSAAEEVCSLLSQQQLIRAAAQREAIVDQRSGTVNLSARRDRASYLLAIEESLPKKKEEYRKLARKSFNANICPEILKEDE